MTQRPSRLFSPILVIAIALLTIFTTACTQVITAQQRTFLDLSLNFLGEYKLPDLKYQDTPVGGLSALTYDRGRDRILALSDDRSSLAPARFYTLNLTLDKKDSEKIGIAKIDIEDVTFIKDENGKNYSPGNIDPEGIALSPKGTVFISSEGVPSKGISPFIREFDQKTGKLQKNIRIPDRFLPNNNTTEAQSPRGVRENLGFEALTLEPNSLAGASGDPFRLFTATESGLFQDTLPPDSEAGARIRLLHYLLGGITPPTIVAEHLYLLDPLPQGGKDNGLTELLALDTGGHFLSLERSYGLLGFGVKLYQITLGGATDTFNIPSLKDDISNIAPIQKKLLLDLSDLKIYLDNLEGMTLGPRLPDGSQSLILVSDNNFNNAQVTQFLLFSLNGLS
jgi:hypothetical protein